MKRVKLSTPKFSVKENKPNKKQERGKIEAMQ